MTCTPTITLKSYSKVLLGNSKSLLKVIEGGLHIFNLIAVTINVSLLRVEPRLVPSELASDVGDFLPNCNKVLGNSTKVSSSGGLVFLKGTVNILFISTNSHWRLSGNDYLD